MSKIAIIPSGNRVNIDGESETVIYTGDKNIHAIHWDDVALSGSIEYTNKADEVINSFTTYQHFITEYFISKAAREQKIIDDVAAEEEALTIQEKKNREYPLSTDYLYALHQARQGDNTAIDAIDEAYIAVDAKYQL